jgi:hypothetical protein
VSVVAERFKSTLKENCYEHKGSLIASSPVICQAKKDTYSLI